MPEHETLAAALAAMQAELPKLRKTETAKVTGESKSGGRVNYSYGYAGLDEVVETVLPALGAHGLSVTSKTTVTDGGFMLEVALLHEGGEREVGHWPLPNPRQAGPQDIGSAMTYGRRYLTLALTGTFPGGEDDDGAKAQQSAREGRGTVSPEEFQQLSKERPQQRQQNAPTSPAGPKPEKVWTDAEVLEQHTKLDSLDLEKAGALYDWMASKDLHSRKVKALTEEGVEPVSATTRLAVRLAHLALDDSTAIEGLAWIREFGDKRGLLKTQVSPKSTLGEWLTEQRDARKQAVIAESDNAQAMQQAAAESWDAPVDDAALAESANDKHPQQ